VIIPPAGAATVGFTLRNLTDKNVSVRPEVTASAGFTATLTQSQLTIPAAGSATVEVTVSAAHDASSGTLTLTAGGDTATVPVARTDNWARLATMSASSTYQPYVASLANDGNTTNSQPGIVMWNDGTPRSFPDTLTATWNQSVTLNRAVVYTLDQAAYPASGYGVRDYDIQALVGGQWQTVATVRGNVAGIITSTFNPVTTSSLRLLITDTNDHTYSRVIEFEAYGP